MVGAEEADGVGQRFMASLCRVRLSQGVWGGLDGVMSWVGFSLGWGLWVWLSWEWVGGYGYP